MTSSLIPLQSPTDHYYPLHVTSWIHSNRTATFSIQTWVVVYVTVWTNLSNHTVESLNWQKCDEEPSHQPPPPPPCWKTISTTITTSTPQVCLPSDPLTHPPAHPPHTSVHFWPRRRQLFPWPWLKSIFTECIDPHHLHPLDHHHYRRPHPLLLFHMWPLEDTHLLRLWSGHFIIWADVRASLELRK